jgi:protoporphyrinogen oxidase
VVARDGPDEGHAALARVFLLRGDGLGTKPDHELVALAAHEMAASASSTRSIVDAAIVRQPKAYPVYDDSLRAHVDAIRLDFELNYPTLIRSAETACTSTTTRITP